MGFRQFSGVKQESILIGLIEENVVRVFIVMLPYSWKVSTGPENRYTPFPYCKDLMLRNILVPCSNCEAGKKAFYVSDKCDLCQNWKSLLLHSSPKET